MARLERFTFLCDKTERLAIAELAKRLCRSQSDAVRFVVLTASREASNYESSVEWVELDHNQNKIIDTS